MDGRNSSSFLGSPLSRSRRGDGGYSSTFSPPFHSSPARNVTFAPTSNVVPNTSSNLFENSFSAVDLPEWGDSMENVRLLRKQLQVVQDIRAELGRKNAMIGTLRAENDALKQQCHHLQATQDHANQLEQRCAALSGDLAVAQQAASEWEGRAKALDRRVQEGAQHAAHLQEGIDTKDRSILNLEASMVGVQEEVADMKALYERERQRKQELEKMSIQVEENLSNALDCEKERARKLELDLACCKEDLADAKAQIAILSEVKRQKDELDVQLVKVHEDYKTATDVNNQSREQAQKESQQLHLELRDLRNRYNLLEDDHRAMASLLQAKEEVIVQMENENNRRVGVDDQFRRSQAENDQLHHKVSELTGRLGSCDGTLREFRAMLRGHRQRVKPPPHQGGTTLRLGAPNAGPNETSSSDMMNNTGQQEFSALDVADSILMELNDVLKELSDLRARAAEADQLERTVMELEQKLHQERISLEEVSLKLSMIEQRSNSLEEDLGSTKKNADSRGTFLENLLHQLRIAGVGVPSSTTPLRGDTNDMFVFISQGVQQLIQIHAEANILKHKLVEAEALVDALRTEISEENHQHRKELKKITERASREAEAFRSKYEGQVAQVIQASKEMEKNMRGTKKQHKEKVEREKGQLKATIRQLEEENSLLKLQLQEDRHQAQQHQVVLNELEGAARVLACGTVPLAHRCRDLLAQKALLARESAAYILLCNQLSVLATSMTDGNAVNGEDLTPRGSRSVERLLDWSDTGGGELGRGSVSASKQVPPSLRAVVVAVVAAHRFLLFANMAKKKKVYFSRRFPFCLLTEDRVSPCSQEILSAPSGVEGWLHLVTAFGDQKQLEAVGVSAAGYPVGVGSNLVIDLNLGLQQHQRRLWERGLLGSDGRSPDSSRPLNRVSRARNQRYASFNTSLQPGGLALVGLIRSKLTQLSVKAADAEALSIELSRQLEAATGDELQFKDGLATERRRVAELKAVFQDLEERGAAREAVLEEELREKDRRLHETEARLRKAKEKANAMKEARDKVQDELFQLHTYMKRNTSGHDHGLNEQNRQIGRAFSRTKPGCRKSSSFSPKPDQNLVPGCSPTQTTSIQIDRPPKFHLDKAASALTMNSRRDSMEVNGVPKSNGERKIMQSVCNDDLSGLYALSPINQRKPEVSLDNSRALTHMAQRLKEQADKAQEVLNLQRQGLS